MTLLHVIVWCNFDHIFCLIISIVLLSFLMKLFYSGNSQLHSLFPTLELDEFVCVCAHACVRVGVIASYNLDTIPCYPWNVCSDV